MQIPQNYKVAFDPEPTSPTCLYSEDISLHVDITMSSMSVALQNNYLEKQSRLLWSIVDDAQ